MQSENRQSIGVGSGNVQARDITVQYFSNYHPSVLRFYENDICMVIEEFNNYIEEFGDDIEEVSETDLDSRGGGFSWHIF